MMENQKSANQWADFWRYEIGVNVIPALNKTKIPKTTWKEWQTEPIPENIHAQWKNQNLFDEGLAIVTGKVFHNEQFKGMWLNGIDCDNKAGTNAMCPSGVAHIAKGTLVEQHDNPDKCHILFYTDEPLKNRAINQNSEYQIEVKSRGKHLLYCAGGYHKDGSLIDIVGTTKVKIAEKDSMEKMLDEHLGTAKISTILDTVESEVKYLHDPNLKKTKGDGGGLDLLRVLDSWKIKNPEYTEKMLLALATEYTHEHHDPVCSDEKVRGLVKQAMGFGEKIIAENSEIEKNQFTGDERINNATDQIQGDHSFVTMEKSEKLLMWTGKIYSESKARKTVKEITEQLIPNCTEHDRIEVINKIKARTYTDIDDFDSDSNVITTENGILTLDTLELIPHTPDNLTMVLLPVEYHTPKFEIHDENIFDDVEKNLKDTLFYKSLKLCFTINDTFREQDFQTVLEMLSSVFVKRHIDSKAFMNLGSGENGKSVFLGYIESLLGNDNVSHIPLQDIASDKFANANLVGKSANIFTDLERNELRDSGKIKAICDGEGIQVQEKHKDGFTLYPFVKLMFSCNKFPKVFDQTQGFFRRWIIIQWSRNFENDPERNEYLRDKLVDNQEEKNLVFSCLVRLANQLNKVGKFTHSKKWEEVQREWNANADPVDDFDTNYIKESEFNKSKRETYQFYKKVMISKQEVPLGMGQFSKAFAEYQEQDKITDKTTGNRTERVWLNIDFIVPKQANFEDFDKS